ncbi:MAG: DNRLRE domain-containing protein [Polyangiaceae bacterium]|nr:DNRLRE domain-containing protein [Polyangiaceae bacterium]
MMNRAAFLAAAVFVQTACTADANDDSHGGGGYGEEATQEAASALGQACVTVRRGVAGSVADAFLSGDSPGWATGNQSTMYTGMSGGGNLNRSLVRYDLSLLPPGAVIVSASAEWTLGWTAAASDINVHRVLSPWAESTVSQANFGSPANVDPAIVATFPTGSGGLKTVDLTALVAGWADGSIPNHGVLLTEPQVNGHLLLTSEAGTVTQRPGLVVCYDCGGACPPDLCDGVVCTAQDNCHDAGACDPATGLCSNPIAGNGTVCDDGDACTLSSSCQAGVCTGANPVVCTPSDQCHTVGTCNPATGVCTDPVAADGSPCSDGNPCTSSDVCTAGACTGAGPNACTCVDVERGGLGNLHDAFLSGDFPWWATGNDPNVYTGLSGGGNVNQTLVAADLTGVIPPYSAILEATLNIHANYNTTYSTVSVYRVEQPWSEATVTATSFGAGGFDPTPIASFSSLGVGYKQADLTNLVDGWYNGTVDNYGVILREPAAEGHSFSSSEAGTNQPYLRVCYAGLCDGVVCVPSDACHVAGVCDITTGLCSNPILDTDGDGLSECTDPCPADPTNSDTDGDGICTDVDNCPTVANPTQQDTNGNGFGDACDGPGKPTLAAGYLHTCAVRNGGEVHCWGGNGSGQLGHGGGVFVYTAPVKVVGLTDAVSVAAGDGHTCALRATGEVACWGGNFYGQLGNGTTTSAPTPVPVSGLSDAVWVAAGDRYTCAVRASGQVVCWGDNAVGQLGNGTTVDSTTPVAVVGLADAVAVAAGAYHTCARRSNGSVDCWGAGGHGALGSGNWDTSTVPTPVSGISDAVGITAGGYHTCAQRASGEFNCWGENFYGALGTGTTADSNTPQVVVNVSPIAGAAAGNYHTCIIKPAGTVECWGYNGVGNLGNGTQGQQSLNPVQVVGLSDAVEVVAGAHHTCALGVTDEIVCWGYGDYGQMGNCKKTKSNPLPLTVLDPVNADDDLPDSTYTDQNGDGIDGSIAAAYFVSLTGSDTNPGTLAAPFRTIGHAVAQANVYTCRPQVLVAAGTYNEAVILPSGVSLWGQYDPVTWTRSVANTTTIQSPTNLGLVATSYDDRPMFVEGFTIQAAGGSTPGQSSQAVRLSDVTSPLYLRYNILKPGAGAGGSPGGVTSNLCSGGAPGPGGTYDTGAGWGGQGCGGAAGGAPGPVWGGWGGPGNNGSPGAHGTLPPNQNVGIFSGLNWQALPGNSGSPGGGGGGGGGGGASICCTLAGCAPTWGGNGGAGGNGGLGGGGGGGAGGSFGIIAFSSPAAIITNNSFLVATGGNGGNGSSGNSGSDGQPGAPGLFCWAGSGGPGGPGGNGGPGGTGAGGGGGMSVGILLYPASTMTISGNAFTLGGGGLGGSGSAYGAAGITADTFVYTP